MDDTMGMIDLTADQRDHTQNSHHSPAIEHHAEAMTSDDAVNSRLESLATPRASGTPQGERFNIFKRKRGLGQHLQSSPMLHTKQEDMRDYIHSSIEDPRYDNGLLASNAGRHRSNDTFRPPSAMGEPIPYRPSQHIDFDFDMMDNEHGPVRPDYQTPTHPSRADHNGLFVAEDEDFPMDHTPTQKRRRIDSAHGYGDRGSQRRQPSVANMTPSSFRNRPSSSSRPSSSGRLQLGIMGRQARGQLNGNQPLNTPPSSRLSNSRVVRPGSRTQAALRAQPAIVTEEDLRPLFLELQSVIKAYQKATAQLLQGQQNINTLRAEIEKEQKEQNDHMNKTLQEFAEKIKKAITEIHETNQYLQHQIDELTKNDPNRTPPRGGAFGGSGLAQAPSPGFFAGLLNNDQPQQQSPARAQTLSRGPSTPGRNRGSS